MLQPVKLLTWFLVTFVSLLASILDIFQAVPYNEPPMHHGSYDINLPGLKIVNTQGAFCCKAVSIPGL